MLKLAFRGILRYKKRTIITAFAISIAILFSIVMQSLLTGIQYDSNKNLIWNDTSSAKVYAPEYFKDRKYLPIDKLISIKQSKDLENILIQNKFSNYTREFIENAQIMFYEDPFPTSGYLDVILKAIDSSNQKAYNFDDTIIKGDWINSKNGGVVIGSKIAADIKADIGYYLTIQTKGKGGFIQAFDIPIIGIISTGDPVVDSNTIFFDLKIIDDYLELEGSVSSYAISYSMNIAKINKLTKENTKKLDQIVSSISLRAYSWQEIADEILALQSADSGFTYIVLFFTFIISIVGISNTMLMSISERKNEIAMLKTLGYTNKYIRTLFTLEGTIIGFFGVIVGSLFGTLISFYYQIKGIDMSYWLKNTDSIGYRINAIVHAFVSPNQILKIAILGLLVSIFAAYIAVRRTGKGEIAQLFRKL